MSVNGPEAARTSPPARPYLDWREQGAYLLREWRAMLDPRTWLSDGLSAIAVALVALPLSLAIARASGVTPYVGLVTAIVGGIVVAFFGGCRLQVSGPAAAMTFLVYEIITKFAQLGREHYGLTDPADALALGMGAVITCTLLAGVLQVAFGAFRLGRFMQFFPRPVIIGFLAGIGITILCTQLPVILGYDVPHNEEGGALALLVNTLKDLEKTSMPSLLVGATAAGLMLFTPRASRRLPAPLIAVVAASLLPILFGWTPQQVQLLGELPRGFPAPSLPQVPWAYPNEIVLAALTIFSLASIESLLSASVVDSLSKGPKTDHDQELVGQGLGNVASALFGGIPVTGVIARSATNIQAGAKTRLSAILHALLILAMMLALGGLVARIPVAALAGVLIAVATRMIEVRMLRFLWKASKVEALVLLATAGAIVATDLTVGVPVGLAASFVYFAYEMSRLQVATDTLAEGGDGNGSNGFTEPGGAPREIQVMSVGGPLFFGSSFHLLNMVAKVRCRYLILDLQKVSLLDMTGAEVLEEAVELLNARGTQVILAGVGPQVRHRLNAMYAEQRGFASLRRCPAYANVRDAMLHAASLLASESPPGTDPLAQYPRLKQAVEEASKSANISVPRVRAVVAGDDDGISVSVPEGGHRPGYVPDEAIRPGPVTSWNFKADRPVIDPTAFIDPRSTIIGQVTIADHVYVGPNVAIRADEGKPFYIGPSSNIQDGVTLHALKDKVVMVRGGAYAIYIGKDVCCTHGALIHGPCFIGDGCFVGFKGIVHNAILGAGCVMGLGAIVVGVTVPPGRYVDHNTVVDTQEKADALPPAPENWLQLRDDVLEVNTQLADGHRASLSAQGEGEAGAEGGIKAPA
jgi:SulP family sulfate permease